MSLKVEGETEASSRHRSNNHMSADRFTVSDRTALRLPYAVNLDVMNPAQDASKSNTKNSVGNSGTTFCESVVYSELSARKGRGGQWDFYLAKVRSLSEQEGEIEAAIHSSI